jgi:4-amino-4-deoxy-L-arabinose transferase-like glycosyltransferase
VPFGAMARLKSLAFSFPVVLAATIVAMTGLHFYGLSEAPPGLYVDEASMGYAAWSISLDGRDEHGASWPLFFESLGDWKSPISIYLTAAVVKVFGLSIPIVRGVPSALNLLAAALLGVLVWQIFRQRWLALGAVATAGLLPWLFVLGRTAISEAAAVPVLLVVFLLMWRWADENANWRRALLAGALLGVAAYAYATVRFFFLLLILALIAAYLPLLRTHGRAIGAAGLAALVVYSPVLVWNSQHPGALTARFTEVSIFTQAHSLGEITEYFWRAYSSAFSLAFWFQTGDPWGRHTTGHGGELYLALAPLLAWGLVGLWRRRREGFWRLIALGPVLAPIPSALTAQFSHSLRNMEAVPFILLIAALGAAELWKDLEGVARRPGFVVSLAALLLVEMTSFTVDYFTAYPQRVWWWFDAGLPTAVAAAEAARQPGQVIVLSDKIDQPALMFAFLTREDPRTYRQFGIGGAYAVAGDVQGRSFPHATLVIAKPDQTVSQAREVYTVWLRGKDDWGRPTGQIAYRVWIIY